MTRGPTVLLTLLLAAACDPGEVSLVIDVRTDLVAGAEFSEIIVSLPDEDIELAPFEVTSGDGFVSAGARVAELEGLEPVGTRRVRVSLFDGAGVLVTESELLVSNLTDTAATVVLTRNCRDVVCPGGGAESQTHCLAGRCVEPECLTGSEPSCPTAECATDGDCPSASACATGACQEGVCLFEADPAACAEDEFCEPTRGCREAPMVLGNDRCEPASYVIPADCTEGAACALNVVDVAAGQYHGCAVDMAGALLCWGPNARGQLGVGDRFARLRPAPVELPSPVASVTVGREFTCALLADASIWCWGHNESGQLGLDDTLTRLEPGAAIAGGPWSSVSAGDDSACAITMSGELYCWGSNAEGQAAQSDPGAAGIDYPAPTVVGTATWSSVDVGEGHACGIQTDGTLHCWGRNSEAQLGQPESAPMQIRTPRQVGVDADWVQVDTSQGSGCGRRVDGTLWCWGRDSETFSSIGFGGLGAVYEPMLRAEAGPWVHVDTEVFHGCALRMDGEAWCWGRAIEGQLGTPEIDPRLVPAPLAFPDPFREIAAGRFATFFVREPDGALLATGENCGLLGIGGLDRPDMLTAVSR